MLDVCLCLVVVVLVVYGGVGRVFGTWSGRMDWCYVCVSCESGLFV